MGKNVIKTKALKALNTLFQAHSINCTCDEGWSGSRCETQTCSLVCQHGGVADAACESCTNCLGAWGGKLCDSWNDTIPIELTLDQLNADVNASHAQLQADLSLKPLCRITQQCVGWGVDATDSKISKLPILELGFGKSSHWWNGFRLPENMFFQPHQNPLFNVDSHPFYKMGDFTQYRDSLLAQNSGRCGIFGKDNEDVFNAYYQNPEDFSITVTSAQFALYDIQLNEDHTTKSGYSFTLDSFAQRALWRLPPIYNNRTKSAFQLFFDNWGSSVVTMSSSGGMVQLVNEWKSILWRHFDPPQLAEQALIDFTIKTGISGHSGTPDPWYKANQVGDQVSCLGGSATTSCTGNVTAWEDSLRENSVLLHYTTDPITQFIKDPLLAANLERAFAAYRTEVNAKWAALPKCPPTCNGVGSCAAPSDQCSCTGTSPCVGGRMCSTLDTTGSVDVTLSTNKPYSSSSKVQCVNGQYTISGSDEAIECQTGPNGQIRISFGWLCSSHVGPWGNRTSSVTIGSESGNGWDCKCDAGCTLTCSFADDMSSVPRVSQVPTKILYQRVG